MNLVHEERKESLGYRAGRVFRTSALLLEKRIANLGINYCQIPYILGILGQEGQTQDDLAACAAVNRAATARTLKNMEDNGLITRKTNPENRRQNLVYSTEKMRDLLDDILSILGEHNKMMLTGFSQEEKLQFFGFMDRVIANLETEVEEVCHGNR